MTKLKFGDSSQGGVAFRSLLTAGPYGSDQFATRVNTRDGSVSVLSTGNSANDSAVMLDLNRLIQGTSQVDQATSAVSEALKNDALPEVTGNTLQEADAKAALSAENLGDFWDRGVSSLDTIVEKQIDTLTMLEDERITADQRTALQNEFSALREEYDRVYTTLSGESRRSWDTPSGFNIKFAGDFSYSAVQIATETVSVSAGSGTTVAMTETTSTTTTALSTGSGSTGEVLDVIGSVSSADDTITILNHGLSVGDFVHLELPGTAPGGLAEGTDYYAIIVDSNRIKLATSSVNATAGTAINITSNGSGALRVLSGVTADFQLSSSFSTGAVGSGTGSTTRINVSSAGTQAIYGGFQNHEEVISADGRYVAFSTFSSNLTAGDTNNTEDVFLRDTVTGTTTLVSSSSAGVQGNYQSNNIAISSNGRYVGFTTPSDNLVSGDNNYQIDAFIKDTLTGTTTLVSTDSAGVQGNATSTLRSISSDGRYVLFSSAASNLVSGDTNGIVDLFLKDTVTGTTTRVSTDSSGTQISDGSLYQFNISANGRYVTFGSTSSTLVAGDTNGSTDIFRKDTQTGAVIRISTDSSGVQSNGGSFASDMSSDGRYVVFQSSSSNLVAGDTNGAIDIFVKDTISGTTTRVNTSASGVEANGNANTAFISDDGRYVAFGSQGNNLISGASGQSVYVKDTTTGAIVLASTNSVGTQGNFNSNASGFSGDGTKVLMYSNSSNLVAGDTNGFSDVFVKTLNPNGAFNSTTDAVTLSGSGLTTGDRVRFSGSGTPPTGLSKNVDYFAIATDTPDVYKLASNYANAFDGTAIDFSGALSGDINAEYNYSTSTTTDSIIKTDHGLTTGTRIRISSTGTAPGGVSEYTDYYAIADDANSFRLATSLVNAEAGTAIDITSAPTGTLNIVALGGGTNAFNATTDEIALRAHGFSTGQTIQFTGSGTTPTGLSKDTDYYVIQGGDANTLKVASSYANALAGTAIDFSGAASGDLAITTTVVQASSGLSTQIGNIFDVNTTDVSAASDSLTISSHGLSTGARLRIEAPSTAPGGLAEAVDYYAIIVDSNTIKLATSSVNASAGTAINITSSGTGTLRVLSQVTGGAQASSTSTQQQIGGVSLGDTTRMVTTSGGGQISQGAQQSTNGFARISSTSTDGRYIAFVSSASDLVAGDTNGEFDFFVKDTLTGSIARINTDSSGTQTSGINISWDSIQGISGDGRYVLFSSHSSTLVAGDTNSDQDLFVKDTVTGTTTRVNTSSSGVEADVSPFQYTSGRISSDGLSVVFNSKAENLVAGDTNSFEDTFKKDLVTGVTTRVSTNSSGVQSATGSNFTPLVSSNGRYVLFTSFSDTLTTGDTNAAEDVFIKDTTTGTTTRVSTDSTGVQGNQSSRAVDISEDGRYVLFRSNASNLVAGDTNGLLDLFVKDTQTGTTTRVNTSSSGVQSDSYDGAIQLASISNDGRYVVFNSLSSTLVAGDTNNDSDIFLKDLTTGALVIANTSSSGTLGNGAIAEISRDGSFIIFSSNASNLVSGDTNSSFDVFKKDLIQSPNSFNTTTDEITIAGSSLTTGSKVRFTGTGTPPTGLSKDTDYYVITTGSADVYKLATSLANALSNTAIDITGATSGTISAQYNFSISPSNDSFTVSSHGFTTGTRVRLSSSSTLPTGLSTYTDYYAIATDANTFKLATSAVNASLGTAIDFTTSGTGTVNFVSLAVGGASNAFDATTDNVTQASHGLTTGQKIRFTGSGSTPTGLSKDTDYYVTGTTTNTFKVATSYANALANTSIDFSGSASGNLFLNPYLTDTRSVGTGTGGSGNIGTMVDKVSTTNDSLTIANHGLTVGDRIRLELPGSDPGGLAEGTDYYAIIVDSNTIKVATSSVNAAAGTAIDITSAGTGNIRALSGVTNGFQVTTGNISAASDSLTITGHGLTTGSRLRLTTSGAVPGGASAYTDYYAIVDNANTIRLATSTVNAGTGTAIDLTSVGSGVLDVSVLGSSAISAFNSTSDEITQTAHGLVTGERIRFSGTGAVPTGLSKNTDYYVIEGGDANTFKVATSYANALASTAIDFSGSPSGDISLLTYTTTAAFDAASDTINATGSNLTTGQRIQLSNRDGTLATGLTAGVDYYAIRVNNNQFKVATSLANAMANTAIDFTGTGSGTTYVTGVSGTSAFDPTTNAITVSSSNTLTTGQAVTLSSNSGGLGYLPTGLSAGTYYVIKDSSTSIRLATSAENAALGTAVDFTGSGSLGVNIVAYSETASSQTGAQPLFDVTSNDGRQAASVTLSNLTSTVSLARATASVGSSRTKSLAAYSRAKNRG